jgi:hypothetical protein
MLKTVTNIVNVSQITGVLPVVNGGTGVTTSTGTGSVVLSAAPTLSGNVGLSTGNLVQGTAAKGFNFTANTPLVGMTSQLLSWYEEGAYTATLSAGSGTYTSISQSLKYTRMGRVVNVTGYIFITTNGTAATNLQFTLPFNCADAKNVSFGGRENQSNGSMFGGTTISTSTVAITKYDGTYLGGAAYNFPISFSYSI